MQVAWADIAVKIDAWYGVDAKLALVKDQLRDGVARTGMGHEDVPVIGGDGDAMSVGGGVEAADQRFARDAVVIDCVDRDAGRLVVGRDQIAPRAVGGHIAGICQSGVERV